MPDVMPSPENSSCLPPAIEAAPDLRALATIKTASADEVIKSLSQELAPVVGPDFLTHCAFAFQHAMAADYFIIARFNPYSNIMRTMRVVIDGAMVENFSYSLDSTPCANAIEDGVCVYPENVADLFPRDKFLKEKGISGYAGTSMKDSAGNALGVLLALTRAPIRESDAACVVLEHFRNRVACIVDMAEKIERKDWALAEATKGVWDWDVVTGGTTLSDSIIELLGYKKTGLFDLSKIEDAIHSEDRPRHTAALRAHLDSGAPFSVMIRLNTREDGWRWFLSRGKAMRNGKGRAVRMIGCFIDVDELVAPAASQQAASA